MADFKKYNGYNVKDASALAHASVSGNTLTTTNRDGNVVDTINLPGGGFPSATYMSYLDSKFVQAHQNTINTDVFNHTMSRTNGCDLGLVASEEVVGYADLTFASNKFTLGDLHVQTIHSWQTFSKDGNVQFNSNLGYENNYLRQIRPNRYRAFVTVGKYGQSITVASDSITTIMQMSMGSVGVKDPSGKTIGSATIVGVEPYIDETNGSKGPVGLYIEGVKIEAYQNSGSSKVVKKFIVEVEIMLYDIDVENFLAAPNNNTPFIESANGYSYSQDASTFDSIAETRVVVKNRANISGYYLDEYKLTYDSTNDSWSWVRTASKAIPDNLTSGTFYNKTFTFEHYIVNVSTSEYQESVSAVAYMIGLGQGSSAAVSRSDAIPLASWLCWPSA